MREVQKTVATLMDVYSTKKPLETIKVDQFRTVGELYGVQEALIQEKRREQGGNVNGYKISLTNVDLQKVFHTDAPLYGTILDQDVATTGEISLQEFFSPLVETELMFIAQEDISLDADADEIIEKMMIAPGLELPDSRIQNWFPNLSVGQLIVDNAVTGKIVVGEQKKIEKSFQLDKISVTLFHNDKQVAQGQSTFVLESPLNAVMWLHNKLASEGKVIKKGTIISSGTFINPLPLEKGAYRAVFDHFGEVAIEIVD